MLVLVREQEWALVQELVRAKEWVQVQVQVQVQEPEWVPAREPVAAPP